MYIEKALLHSNVTRESDTMSFTYTVVQSMYNMVPVTCRPFFACELKHNPHQMEAHMLSMCRADGSNCKSHSSNCAVIQ